MIIEELNVARLEGHVEHELVGKRAEKLERFFLRRSQTGHFRKMLRGADVCGREHAGEVALTKTENGLGVRAGFTGPLVALAAVVPVCIKKFDQVRPAPQHLVVNPRRAHDPAVTAGLRFAHTEQSDDVTAVGVKRQGIRSLRPAISGALDRLAFVFDKPEKLAAAALGNGSPEMRADAPVDGAQLVGRVFGRQTTQHDHAAAALELLRHFRKLDGKARQREILARDVGPVESPSLNARERTIDLVELFATERTNPLGRVLKVGALPCERRHDLFVWLEMHPSPPTHPCTRRRRRA
jgi:hypothetical protein